MKAPIESFIVRVYRCRSGSRQQLVGVVEAPRRAGSKAFTSVAQLWDILSEPMPAARTRPRAPRGGE